MAQNDIDKLDTCDPRRAVIQLIDETDAMLGQCEQKLAIIYDYLDHRSNIYKRRVESEHHG